MRRILKRTEYETSGTRNHPRDCGAICALRCPSAIGPRMVTTMRAAIIAGTFTCSIIFVMASGAYHHTSQATHTNAPPDTRRSSVLVELFTSEGCSSCPPADELLRKLDESQPVAGAEVIALSEHVDYWDDIGWKDPFSAHANSERQDRYAAGFRTGGVYTPQMVVNGEFELVGSDARGAIQAIGKAAAMQKIAVSITSVRGNPNGKVSLNVQTEPLPASSGAPSANVLIAVADDKDVSSVDRGENSGRTLTHVAVLRELKTVGTVDKAKGFSSDVETDIPASSPKKLRIVVIVQEGHEGKIAGVASVRYPN
jgi:hypothetical protein